MTSIRTMFEYQDLEAVAKSVYAQMEAEAAELEIQPWPRWNRSQIVGEAVFGVAFSTQT